MTNLHRKPSSAWRKDRRRDPIQSEALDMSRTNNHHNRPSVIVPPTTQVGKQSLIMIPEKKKDIINIFFWISINKVQVKILMEDNFSCYVTDEKFRS